MHPAADLLGGATAAALSNAGAAPGPLGRADDVEPGAVATG
ncbi:hypothetical protein [Streptomyces canus]